MFISLLSYLKQVIPKLVSQCGDFLRNILKLRQAFPYTHMCHAHVLYLCMCTVFILGI